MTARRPSPGDYQEWLNRARSNLARSKQRLPEVYLEDLCFDAQQAAEKALKALLISLGVRPPRSHDIAELLTAIERAGVAVSNLRKAATLSEYAVESRYPGLAEPVNEEEYEAAISTAQAVVDWVDKVLERERKQTQ